MIGVRLVVRSPGLWRRKEDIPIKLEELLGEVFKAHNISCLKETKSQELEHLSRDSSARTSRNTPFPRFELPDYVSAVGYCE